MDSNKRACLAFIIGRAVNQNYQSVYDFGVGKLCMFTSEEQIMSQDVINPTAAGMNIIGMTAIRNELTSRISLTFKSLHSRAANMRAIP